MLVPLNWSVNLDFNDTLIIFNSLIFIASLGIFLKDSLVSLQFVLMYDYSQKKMSRRS